MGLNLGRYVSVARLAQSVEHGTLNPRVVGSSPTLGEALLPGHPQKVLCQLQAAAQVGSAMSVYAQLTTPYQVRGYSSVAEHSTADREVTGSTPVVPLEFFLFCTV